MSVISLILSGGAGTRLWPLSRSSKPKQFLPLDGSKTLFQNTLLRCQTSILSRKPIIVASNAHRFLVAENLREVELEAEIILEPVPRNSCAAIAAGCFAALNRDPDAMVLVLAADHKIEDQKAFEKTIRAAKPLAVSGQLVTFGVKPDRPATGYGYIAPADPINGTCGFGVSEFVEKPDEQVAIEYLKNGYYWNSGNFMFKARTFIDELLKYAPQIHDAVLRAFDDGQQDLDFFRLDENAFTSAENISVDYAIMERTDKAVVVPVDHDWSDIGTWNSVWRNHQRDTNENAVNGNAVFKNSSRNLVHSENHLTALVGVNDVIVVATRDVVLVAAQSEDERVKDIVDQLAMDGKPEATQAIQVYRPWGNYEAIDAGGKYQVKRIEILPGGELSLQKHEKRAEHWIVVDGTPDVMIGNETVRLQPNQSVYIPKGTIHRLSNLTDNPVVLIEVQTGTYFGEDDIIRIEDKYNRKADEC